MRSSPFRLALTSFVSASLVVALSSQAAAFCGFYVSDAEGGLYNDATQVVLMREGTRTVLSMQNNYQGPPEDFAMVVPVPVVLQKEDVKTLPPKIFDDVNTMASPRLVEYWEQDPCNPVVMMDDLLLSMTTGVAVDLEMLESEDDTEVKIEAQFEVGEYEIVVLSAKDSNGLDRWLRANKYKIPEGAEPVLRPYIDQGMYFFVARVNVDKVQFKDGRASLSPLRFHYDSKSFSLPIRLGLLNAKEAQDLIVHILAREQRYQVVDRKNITIPTNIGVQDKTRERFGEFYAALFDRTLEENPGAVVTEYSWDASGCDPCPGPNLTSEHFVTLGADVLPSKSAWGYVLTRLHTRYTKETATEDLVFSAAPPIVGGREHVVKDGELEEGSQPGSINNFQARYIIRHPWKGAIECENPQRGVWGGPPGRVQDASPVHAAGDTAFVPRGNLELASYVTTKVPGLKSLESAPKTQPPHRPNTRQQDALQMTSGEGGCASCSIGGTTQKTAPWFLAGFVALAWGWRRKKRR